MNINTITAEDLRRMPDKEGLILQGCGGDLTEWVDGINEMLTKAGILKDGCQFENVAAFQHGELTCLLYPFDDVKLDIGKLALWRLQTHEVYGGTWLSDFVPNYLGGFIETPEALADKPDCPLIGADGNIFNLLGIASRTLLEHGLKEQAKEMSDRVFVSGSYGEALCIIGEYVNITDSELEHKNSLRQQLKATKPADPVKSNKLQTAGTIRRDAKWKGNGPMVYGQYEAALLFSDRHKAGARKMENRWSLIAKPTLKTMQRKPTSIRQQMSDTM